MIIRFDGRFRIDLNSKEVWVDGNLIPLTKMEWEIFKVIFENKGAPITGHEIDAKIHGFATVRNSLARWHVSHMRPKLAPLEIEHRRGFGYALKLDGKPLFSQFRNYNAPEFVDVNEFGNA